MDIKANIGIKAGALFLAVLLWFHVATEKHYEVTVSVPVALQLPEDMAISEPPPKTAKVRLWGKGKHLLFLKLLHYSKVRLVVRANPKGPGRIRRVLSPMDVEVPKGLDVRALELLKPSVLEVEVDRRMNRKVPVVPVLEFSPAPGYVALAPKVRPDSVTVSGPEGIVRKVRTVRTDSLEVPTLRKSVSLELKVIPPSPLVSCLPPKVYVDLEVQPIAERWLKGVQVRLVHAPKGAWVVPDRVDVKVSGAADLLSRISPDDIGAYIDYRRLREGEPPEPSFSLPPGVRFLRAEPSSFHVRLP